MSKTTSEHSARKEKTIEEKQKLTRQSAIVEGAGLSIVCAYFVANYCAYSAEHVRADMGECLNGTVTEILHNPLYFWPIVPSAYAAILVTVLFVLLFVFMQYTINKLRVHHDINTLKGSAKWGDVKEFTNRMADWVDEKHKKLGDYNAIFSDKLRMSLNYKKHDHTMNTLVLGTTGTGKSYTIIKPNICQTNANFVITDPKGELLLSCGEMLRRFGYHVRVFDLVDMGHCDAYNPMKYCYKESDINSLVNAFIKNTDPEGGGGGGNKDPFWDDSMRAFLCACIALLIDYCGDKTEDAAGPLTPEIKANLICTGNSQKQGVDLLEQLQPNFATLCQLTRMANTPDSGVSKDSMKNNTANGSELNTIFSHIEERFIEAGISEMPYCFRMWKNFKIAPEKTSTTILMTAATRLQPFNIEQVIQLTSFDTIELDKFANEKSALFVITPVNNSTYNFLVSFLYTQLFDILYTAGEKGCEGSMDLVIKEDLVRHFSKERMENDIEGVKKEIASIKNARLYKINGPTYEGVGKNKKGKKTHVKLDDSYYCIVDDGYNPKQYEDCLAQFKNANQNEYPTELDVEFGEHLVSRRPTKELAEKYLHTLKNAKERKGKGTRLPMHTRFLMDEFPNICGVPEFCQKLSTIRSYEISTIIICQTLSQLKAKYEKEYEVIDANCPEVVFLGGTENTNNEYISKKMGMMTVKGWNNSVDSKKVNMSYNVEQRELMRPDELGKMARRHNITIIDGEDPIYDKTFDFQKHEKYQFTHDYANDIGAPKAYVYSHDIHDKAVEKAKQLALLNHMAPTKPVAVPTVQQMSGAAILKALSGSIPNMPRIPREVEDWEDIMNAAAGGSFEDTSVGDLIGASEAAGF